MKKTSKFISRFLEAVSLRLWWLDVLYPIVLALGLVGMFTYVMYSGLKHMRLSSIGENSLIRTSLLMLNTSRIVAAQSTIVISAEESDLAQVPIANGSVVRDASIEGYAKVLRRVAFSSPKLVVLSWTPSAHIGLEADYEPLYEAFRQVPMGVKILFAYPPTEKWTVPVNLQKVATFVDDGPCDDFSEVQLACPLPASQVFDDWIIPNILQAITPNFPELRRVGKISEYIARTHPSFLVNATPETALKKLTFSEVLAPSLDLQVFRDKVVLLGSNLIQPPEVSSNVAIRRVFTNQSPQRESLRLHGTPMHVFWAQIIELFAQDNLVRIPTAHEQTGISILFCLCILAILYRLGDVAAIGSFLGFITLGPAINAFSIKLFESYIPLFDLFYFGLGTLILAGFGRLSKEAFDRWRIDERLRYHSHTADLKGNFTSLVSHNLNTPIAKQQGILEMLRQNPRANEWGSHIAKASSLSALLQLYVKCVLVTTAIEERSLNFVGCTAPRLREELSGNFSALLGKLGIHLVLPSSDSAGDDADLVPVRLDIRGITTALAALLVLAKNEAYEEVSDVQLRFAATFSEEGPAVLCIHLQWLNPTEKTILGISKVIESLASLSIDEPLPRFPATRTAQILERLLKRALQIHSCKVAGTISNAFTSSTESHHSLTLRVSGP